MGLFTKHPPQIVFRAAILIGCVALLLGVAGVFHFGTTDREGDVRDPDREAMVLLRGVEAGPGLQVEARWENAEGGALVEVGRPGDEALTWRFLRAPGGEPLILTVWRATGSRRERLHEQPAILTRGAGFEVVVPAATR